MLNTELKNTQRRLSKHKFSHEAENVGQLQVNPNIQSTSKRSKSELHPMMADDE